MRLRSYQNEAVDYAEASYIFGTQKIVIEAPTGSGKSLMIAELCRRFKQEKVYVLVNVSKLIPQIADHLIALDIDHTILKSGYSIPYDNSKRVELMMEQTYHARKDKTTLEPGIIIRDEHHIGVEGDRFSGFTAKCNPKLITGFSATPYDQFGVALKGYETASFADIKSLTDQGYLMPADTYVSNASQRIDLTTIGKSGDFSESELDGLLNNDEYNQDVVDIYKEVSGNHGILSTDIREKFKSRSYHGKVGKDRLDI